MALGSSAPTDVQARRRTVRRRRSWIAAVFGLLLLAGVLQAGPAFAQGEGVLSIDKTVSEPGPFQPGDTFTYTITVSCSNTTALGCDNAQLTDTLPAPLVLDPDGAPVTVTGVVQSEVTVQGDNAFTVDFTSPLEPGFDGLPAGRVITIIVDVMVPLDASGDDAGTLTNTATITADNAETISDSADVVIEVPVELASTVTKDIAQAGPIPAVPGEPVDFAIGGANTSNASVDALMIQDPQDGGADPFEYLAFTGIDSITPPDGADTVQVDWLDSNGVWHTGTPTSPIPADPNTLLAEPVDFADVHGLRFTFTSSDGTVPVTPDGGDAAIAVGTETRDNVTDIPAGSTETVTNTASSVVQLDDQSSPPVTADDAVVIERNPPEVAIDKAFARDQLIPGDSTTATILATNSSTPVTEMVITEPAAGTPDLVAQGLTFDGFTDDVAWPANATEVEVVYTYEDGTTETLTSTDANTIPAPTGGRVAGFTITFTGPIQANAQANLPFDVTADPLPGTDPVTTTNTASAQVTASTGEESDVVTDPADMTRNPVRVSTNVTKDILNPEIPGVPGAGSVVSITGDVDDQGPDASTIGSEYLVISDPPNPQPGDPPTDFWNHFDVTSLGPTDVPANADLEVEYWNGTEWVAFPGGTVTGPGTFTATLPPPPPEDVQGLRFTFTPKPGELLPPGFNVVVHFNVELRDQLRDGSGPATPDPDGDPVTIDNTAGSEVHNDDAVVPTDNATDDDSIVVDPVSGDGPGDTIEKGWLVDGTPQDTGATVVALTDDQRTARISWSTNLFPADSYVIQDHDPAEPVVGSVFDAWNLVRIEPITADTDPLMTFDAIESVVLLTEGGGEEDITAAACALGCDGEFGGYTLTEDQQDDAIGVRITYVESPTRASRIDSPEDPQVGTGVARSSGDDRPLDLTFQLRQQLRSDPDQAVLGELHDYTYNTGEPGLVDNVASGTLNNGGDSYTATDDAQIQILDSPVDVETTKEFDQAQLPVPPAGTEQSDYPLLTADLTATNASVAKVRELSIRDPQGPQPTNPEPFQTLDLHEIGTITVPDGATDTQVVLYRSFSGTPTDTLTIAEAQALTPDQLTTVTGIEVVHTGFIESEATTEVELTFQLRATNRVTGDPPAATDTPIPNTIVATASNPSETATGTATDDFTLVAPTYGVEAAKSIDPAERVEDEPNDYTVTLAGQPTGTVRTVELTLADTTATFWNAFDFVGFTPITLQSPIRQLKVDALVGITYDEVDDALVPLCGGSPDLDACWEEGVYVASDGAGNITPALPDGVAAGDVRGLRISAQNADGTNWEQPINPQLVVPFDAAMRDFLIYGPDGEADTVPVPSTQPGLPTAPGETVQGQTTDTVDVHGLGTWVAPNDLPWEADASASDTTILRHLTNGISVTKEPGNGSATDPPNFAPSQRIPYVLTYENTGDWPMTGLELFDQIETDADGSLLIEPRNANGQPAPDYSFELVGGDGTAKPVDGFDASLDEDTGLLTIDVPADFVFEPDDVLTVNAPLVFRLGLPPGTVVENSTTATSDRTFDTCEFTTDETQGDTTDLVDECTAVTHVEPDAASPLAVVKSVRGVGAGVEGAAPGDANYDDLGRLVTGGSGTSACESPNAPRGYYRTPCVPITRPGGIERWQFSAANVGNIPARVIAGIDTFPQYGDVGVITGTDRGSEWATTLVGNPTNNLDTVDNQDKSVQWYYSNTVPGSDCNDADILDETTPGGLPADDECFDEVNGREWIPADASTPESELADAVAVKFVITYAEPDGGLQPGSVIHLTMDTRTAWTVDNPVGDELPIAWNSVASGTQGVFGDQTVVTPVTEPTRVGVATATGKFELQKLVDAPEFEDIDLPSSYPFRVECTSGSEDVTLLYSAGNSAELVQVAADGTVLTYNADDNVNLPLYADCTVSEDPVAQGATVTYDPAGTGNTSGPVTALSDQSARDDIADPAFPDALELAEIDVTNTYAAGGFDVTKAVDDGGAVDQDGDAITYDETYTFTASCIFQGQEAVPEGQREFTLAEGEVEEFDNLPAGSECTVEETDAGTSATTSVVVTEDGDEGAPTDGTTAEFTIGADDADGTHVNAVAFTNHYTVGAVEIAKDVAGDGADDWGAGPFEVAMVCTLDSATPTTVFDDTQTLTPPDLTWEVTNLPTGAECTVTETATGGANDVEITPSTFTVGDDTADPALVTVTNTFTLGSIELRKVHLGGGADARDGSITFSLSCTREVDGETETIAVPGGPDRELVQVNGDPNTVSWTGLPTGATCEVEETDNTAPTPEETIITPDSIVVPEGTTAPVEFVALNVYERGSLAIEKQVAGDAAAFGPDEFLVAVRCTAPGGTPVPLGPPVGLDGTVLVPGNGTVTIDNVPAEATCEVTQEAPSGATDTDLGEPVVIEPGETAEIEVTNTYDATGFTVRKLVDGATDADGKPIRYTDDFTFTASCTFLGEEVLPVADQAFTLHKGDSHTVAGLPVGADCVVEETGDGTASGTSVVVTQGGDPVETDGGTATSSGEFTLVEGGTDATLVGYTNTMPVGAITLTKAVAGDGGALWGDGEFRVRLTCTFAGADPTTVYDATRTMSRAEPTWTVRRLPVGASCDVTEPATGGATSTTITPASPVTITADATTPVTVTVTNTFDVGSVSVEKRIVGSGADERGGVRFVVSLACTHDVDGVTEDVEIPGGATRTLRRPDRLVATYDGLPVGADCAVTETETGDADETTIEPGTLTVGPESADEPVQVIVKNRFGAPAEGGGPGGADEPPGAGPDDDDQPDGGLIPDGGLPGTGSSIPMGLLWLAVGLLAAGVGSVTVALRRGRGR
ncbi:DUF5979 domain-containing protein [Nocardioides sp. YIM 152315]|uniref:DUF5979 domain-containing protein n=1 Tax=Nocardioides sp. YIM 152315 TaxID=3031760 RepID=UPI0023D9AD74|nr:DUF5979 domain-containing protein [Nocardioides sp. YIM 152315]MDF1602871.1 DUF5979 domain-containing protein [Nocardioides sp. YIM 152315]